MVTQQRAAACVCRTWLRKPVWWSARFTRVGAGRCSRSAWLTNHYYLKPVSDPSGTIVFAADIAGAASTIGVGTPRELFLNHESQTANGRSYDVADGPRFLLEERAPSVKSAAVTRLDLVLNWTSTLPTGR
jgi:hypothetical protein